MSRWVPVATGLAAFLLYVATMAHAHQGDTPVYVQQIQSGDWLARSHMLPRPLGALAVAIGNFLAPSAGPYPPLLVLDALAGGAAVGLLQAWVMRLTARPLLAVGVAAGLAASRTVWSIATTFELALFPLVPLLAAGLLATSSARLSRPLLTAAGAGLLFAVAFGFHAISFGAFPAFALLFALEDRPVRHRVVSVVVFGAAAVLGILAVFQVAVWLWEPAGAANTNIFRFIAQFAEPTKDAAEGRIQSKWLAVDGFSAALIAAGWSAWVVGAWALAVLYGTFRLGREGWARHRGVFVFPMAWLVGITGMAMRVEAGNWEYYAQPIAACFLWSGLLVALAGRAIIGTSGALVAAVLVGAGNLPTVLRLHASADGTHRETSPFSGGGGMGPGAQPNGGPGGGPGGDQGGGR